MMKVQHELSELESSLKDLEGLVEKLRCALLPVMRGWDGTSTPDPLVRTEPELAQAIRDRRNTADVLVAKLLGIIERLEV